MLDMLSIFYFYSRGIFFLSQHQSKRKDSKKLQRLILGRIFSPSLQRLHKIRPGGREKLWQLKSRTGKWSVGSGCRVEETWGRATKSILHKLIITKPWSFKPWVPVSPPEKHQRLGCMGKDEGQQGEPHPRPELNLWGGLPPSKGSSAPPSEVFLSLMRLKVSDSKD